MPREAEERLEDAVQELRFALRDPDQMRSQRTVDRLRELTGNDCDWRLAVGRAMSLAATDSVPTGCTELTPFPAASSAPALVSPNIIT